MKIGFIGSRGIPACYSGFETFVEQLSVRLARRGHDVTVYNRIPFHPYREPEYQGVKIVRLPTLRTKATDTILHSLLSSVHAIGARYDVAYFCGVGNALLSVLPRTFGAKTIINVDGADFARAKWSGFGRWWLQRSERWATQVADAVIADNGTIQKRYRDHYGVDATLIPYGANIVTTDPGSEVLKRYGLTPGNYFLYVSRLTPENAADVAIEAYLESQQTLPLVIVGDAFYQSQYIGRLKALAARSTKIILTGFQFGSAYEQLSYHARAFVLPAAIDATRPVLLDQMGFGNCIIVRDTPGNLEVIADTGVTFSDADPAHSLAAVLDRIAAHPEGAHNLGRRAQERVAQFYDWEVVATRYEEFFTRLRQA